MTMILNYFPGMDEKEQIKELLTHDDYSFICADTEKMAFDIALNNKLSCVITELASDPQENIKFIKKFFKINQKMPFVFIYDYVDDDTKARFEKYNCKLLQRPFQRSEILTQIEQLLEATHAKD